MLAALGLTEQKPESWDTGGGVSPACGLPGIPGKKAMPQGEPAPGRVSSLTCTVLEHWSWSHLKHSPHAAGVARGIVL